MVEGLNWICWSEYVLVTGPTRRSDPRPVWLMPPSYDEVGRWRQLVGKPLVSTSNDPFATRLAPACEPGVAVAAGVEVEVRVGVRVVVAPAGAVGVRVGVLDGVRVAVAVGPVAVAVAVGVPAPLVTSSKTLPSPAGNVIGAPREYRAPVSRSLSCPLKLDEVSVRAAEPEQVPRFTTTANCRRPSLLARVLTYGLFGPETVMMLVTRRASTRADRSGPRRCASKPISLKSVGASLSPTQSCCVE